MRVLLLNGPNLNLLGTRDPEVYGWTTLPEVEAAFRGWAAELGVTAVEALQSNHEGHLIDRIHAARTSVDAIVFNPGALTHTSWALHDAIQAVGIPTVEVHISDVEDREPWRRTSCVRPACVHTVYGRGIEGYRWALTHLVARAAHPVRSLPHGPHPEQHADLRLPAGDGPAPLVVVVHGGFWRHRWTRDTTDRQALDLVRRGVASLNVEYRRTGPDGNPGAGGGGGGLRSVEDVADAIAAALADDAVDADRWAVVGHSAGAQLAIAATALLAGRSGDGATTTPPRLVAAVGGVLDLEAAIVDDLGDGAAVRYVDGDDVDRLNPRALIPLGAPLLVAHGRADDEVPLRHAEAFAADAAAAGDDVEVLPHDGGHYEVLDPAEPAWTDVADRLVAAVRRD